MKRSVAAAVVAASACGITAAGWLAGGGVPTVAGVKGFQARFFQFEFPPSAMADGTQQIVQQTLEGSFSVVSTPLIARIGPSFRVKFVQDR